MNSLDAYRLDDRVVVLTGASSGLGAGTRVVTHTAEAAVTAPAGSWRSGDGTVRNLAVQDALADEAGPGADR